MLRKILTTVILLTFLITMTACGGGEQQTSADQPAETIVDEPADEDIQEEEEEEEVITDSNFLMPDTSMRPYAVMIDNEGSRSLPQGGIYKAQIIYEILVEGGETRLMPLFWGTDPELIGPVRSSRHYFLDYAMENDAIYVHYGWSPMAQKDISTYKINNINGVGYGGEIYWDLTDDPRNWQDSYTSMEKILEFTNNKAKYRTSSEKTPVFNFDKNFAGLESEKTADKITIKYSGAYTCGYEYDSEKKSYLRFRKGKPQIERSTNEQLEAAGIIIQFNNVYSIKGDTAGRQDVKTVGSGEGYYIAEGKVIDIKWSKKDRFSASQYTDSSGRPLSLKPGRTWVQVVPMSGTVTIE
jgi:hypothetical protein